MFKRSRFLALLVVGVGDLLGSPAAMGKFAPFAANQPDEKVPPLGWPAATATRNGEYLPNPSLPFGGTINLNAIDSRPFWPPRVVPPKVAPNVLLIMTDNIWGSDKTYPHMNVAWTWVFDTPFKGTKQVASYFGGTRQGMCMAWPGRIKDGGGIGHQFRNVLKGKPAFTWNLLDLERVKWAGKEALAPGKHKLEFEFAYDGPGLGKGGTDVLKVDGKEVACKKMARTVPVIMQWDETFDVGSDTSIPVGDKDYQCPFAFTGKLEKLTVTIGPSQILSEEKKTTQKKIGERD